MKVRHIAEAIILQSIEDLWDGEQREECVLFFRGSDFHLCAEIAGITGSDKDKLLTMIDGLLQGGRRTDQAGRLCEYSFGGR
jgi:hypothetical protein